MRRIEVAFSTLKGLTLTKIEGAEPGSDEVSLFTTQGHRFDLYHQQDCCESVSINDVEGDIADVIGSPLVLVEEVSSSDPLPGDEAKGAESFTWTFYRLATTKGFAVIRWFGESNGYYSERVDCGLTVGNYEVQQDDQVWSVVCPDGQRVKFSGHAAAVTFAKIERSNHGIADPS